MTATWIGKEESPNLYDLFQRIEKKSGEEGGDGSYNNDGNEDKKRAMKWGDTS